MEFFKEEKREVGSYTGAQHSFTPIFFLFLKKYQFWSWNKNLIIGLVHECLISKEETSLLAKKNASAWESIS